MVDSKYVLGMNGTEYPEKVCFYQAGSAVLTDIELDLCPQWREIYPESYRHSGPRRLFL